MKHPYLVGAAIAAATGYGVMRAWTSPSIRLNERWYNLLDGYGPLRNDEAAFRHPQDFVSTSTGYQRKTAAVPR